MLIKLLSLTGRIYFYGRSMSSFKHTNKLATEKSPYLLQHAHNPVNWYPWGKEAFSEAKQRDIPIFLSIGYSTCHWCHVMEHESFEDEQIAAQLNKNFVSIKVDREEHPDIDHQYMIFVQTVQGSGGWPLSVFLTPEGKPFFGGTYFPPEDSPYGLPSFTKVITLIRELWSNNKERVIQTADSGVEALQMLSMANLRSDNELSVVENAETLKASLSNSYDNVFGGFGPGPKFPMVSNLFFLLAHGSKDCIDMLLNTLNEMRKRGIHDHVGGGFHRYTVDEEWRVPHFEKMVYDQAQLIDIYSRVARHTSKNWPKKTVIDIVDYCKRRLLSREGGFYSAEDADSLPTHHSKEKEEGAFAVWSTSDVEKAAETPQDAQLFCVAFGMTSKGNVSPSHNPRGEFNGKNILFKEHHLSWIANEFSMSIEKVKKSLRETSLRLREVQDNVRPRPNLDDKIITAWNGFMISALVTAARRLNEPSFWDLALRTANFVICKDNSELKRSLDSNIEGTSLDYASSIKACLDLYEESLDTKWKQRAIQLQMKMNEKFWDQSDKSGGYRLSTSEFMLAPLKDPYDGAEPCSNSIALGNLSRLARLETENNFNEFYKKQLQFVLNAGKQVPLGIGIALSIKDILIQLYGPSPDTVKSFQKVALDSRENEFGVSIDYIKADYVGCHICRDYVCGPPITSPEELERELAK